MFAIIYRSPTLTNFYPILTEVYRMRVNCYGEKESRKPGLSSLLLQGGINPLNTLRNTRKHQESLSKPTCPQQQVSSVAKCL